MDGTSFSHRRDGGTVANCRGCREHATPPSVSGTHSRPKKIDKIEQIPKGGVLRCRANTQQIYIKHFL